MYGALSWLRARPSRLRAADISLAAALCVFALAMCEVGPQRMRVPLTAWLVAVTVVTFTALPLRRRRPVLALALTTAGAAVYLLRVAYHPPVLLAPLIVLHHTAATTDRRTALRRGVPVVAVLVGSRVVARPEEWSSSRTLAVAALASVVATWAAFLMLLVRFWREGRGAEQPGWRREEFLRMLRFGLPSGVNWFLEFAAFLFFIDVVFARLGTVALAALMAVLQLNTVAFMPAFGVASAGAIQVGNALGAKAHDRVPALVWRATAVACGWMLLVGLSYALSPRLLLGIFARGAGAETEAMVSLGAQLLLVSVGWQLFDGLAMTVSEALRAAGDTAWPMWARIAIAWLLFVPATMLTVRLGGGPVASLLWTVAYMALLATLLHLRFRSGNWRSIALTAPAS